MSTKTTVPKNNKHGANRPFIDSSTFYFWSVDKSSVIRGAHVDGHVMKVHNAGTTRHASDARRLRRSPKDESYGENLKAMDASDPAAGDLGTLASGSSDDALGHRSRGGLRCVCGPARRQVMRDALFTLGFDEIPDELHHERRRRRRRREDGGKTAAREATSARCRSDTASGRSSTPRRWRPRWPASVPDRRTRVRQEGDERSPGANGATDRRAAQGGDESRHRVHGVRPRRRIHRRRRPDVVDVREG